MSTGALTFALATLLIVGDSPAPPLAETPCARTFRLCWHDRGVKPVSVFLRSVVPESPSRPPVVLLHFASGHSGYMAPVSLELARRGYPVYAYDLLDHGLTKGPHGIVEHNLRVLDQVCAYVRRQHGPAPIALAGSSYGGDLCVAYAILDALRQKKYGAPSIVGSVVGQGLITAWQRDVARRFTLGFRLMFLTEPLPIQLLIPFRVRTEWLFPRMWLFDSSKLRREYRRDPLRARSFPASAMVKTTRYRPEFPTGPILTPLLVLEGSRDRLVKPKYERRVFDGLQRYFAHCQLEVLGGASHGMFLEQASRTADALDGWFSETLPNLPVGGHDKACAALPLKKFGQWPCAYGNRRPTMELEEIEIVDFEPPASSVATRRKARRVSPVVGGDQPLTLSAGAEKMAARSHTRSAQSTRPIGMDDSELSR